ncbi:MAG TPA: DUF3604 domain-containing protein [Armatimonadota bacterium]|nr:DUF3604 domain-containing protein [Armatimonadota bacterium]
MYGRIELGWVEIEPSGPVIAGSIGDWRLTYHVGALGFDDGGTIKIAMRFASDWGTPQNTDPSTLNYFSVTTTGISKLKPRFDRKAYYRPWQKAIVIDVLDDALAPGDTVTLTLHNSEAQTFCERTFEFRVAVDCFGAGVFLDLPEQPELEIVNGPPAELVLVSPTEAVVGEPFWLGVKLEDIWGNPCRDFEGRVNLRSEAKLTGLPDSASLGRIEGIVAHEPVIIRISASFGELTAISPPIEVTAESSEYRPLWGDLHGQSEETIGTNSIEDYWTFARDWAFLDFCGHQGNDFQITPEFWRRVKDTAAEFHEPGRFITIPGYEWSAVHPNGGDRNVHFLEDDPEIFRSSRWQAPDAPPENEANDAHQLFDRLEWTDGIVVAHVGGRPANLAFHDDEIEPLIEVASAWGKFEWMIEDAFQMGYKVGFCAGSDDHKGRPGASYPGRSFFGWYGGLTCVYAKELTRGAIFEALRARRCYATTGQRMMLRVSCDGHVMGEEYRAKGPRHISIRAIGTAPIERIDLFRNIELLASWPEKIERSANRIRISWGGARIRGRGRNAEWDSFLEVRGSEILAAEPYAMDSPAETVSLEGNRVTWRSCTAGDDDGVILTLANPESAVIHFECPLLETEVRATDLPVRADLGGVGLHVTFEALPLASEHCVSVEFVDQDQRSAAYWVRVTQSDGNLAWTSPIYVSPQ